MLNVIPYDVQKGFRLAQLRARHDDDLLDIWV